MPLEHVSQSELLSDRLGGDVVEHDPLVLLTHYLLLCTNNRTIFMNIYLVNFPFPLENISLMVQTVRPQ